MRAWIRVVVALGLALVSSSPDGASCGVRLAGRLTVFATGPADALSTHLCASPAKPDAEVLGDGVPPRLAPAQTQAPDRLLAGLVGVALVLAGGWGALLVCRARR